MTDWSLFPHTQIDVLRHGMCEGGEIFRGSTDVCLNDQGWQQMAEAVEGLHWDQIITSPLKRCRLFAEKLSAESKIPVQVDERWREFHFGVWEGRLREEVWAEQGDDVIQFFSDPLSFTPTGGDSYLSVRERIDNAWNDMLGLHSEKKILVITHGGIFRALHASIKSLPSDAFNSIEVPYACLSRWKHFKYQNSSDDGSGRPSRATMSFHNRLQSN